MTLGEPIGYSYINSVDNISTYYPKGLYSGQVHQSLQGDPSLKMYVYDAPSNLVALGIDMDTHPIVLESITGSECDRLLHLQGGF
jgi:hypothetical protein